jgi:hypothetical protein
LQPVFDFESFNKCEVSVSREESQAVGSGDGGDLNIHIGNWSANSPQFALDSAELNRGACIVFMLLERSKKPKQVSLIFFDTRTVEHHKPQFANRWLAELEGVRGG